MIIAYTFQDNLLNKIELHPKDAVPSGTVWIDLVEPTLEEEKFIEKVFDIDAPTKEEMNKIEVMSPFYKEKDAFYMTITVLHKPDADYPDSTAITVILKSEIIITLRYARPRSFNNFATRAMRSPNLCASPEIVFEGLVNAVINRIADALETTGNSLDKMLKDLFDNSIVKTKDRKKVNHNSTTYYNSVIKQIGRVGNVISKNRESLQSINRMLIFYSQSENLSKRDHRQRFRVISREILALIEYANFLASRNAFLLDATLGMLSVEQNFIIKLFTIAAAGFMPPTLIASIYGMNFHSMPELSWEYGYPLVLLAIVGSALIPYKFFKYKGWI